MKNIFSMKTVGAFLTGVLITVLLWNPLAVLAQGPNGFTKIGSTVTTSYVDSTVVSGTVYQYAVTGTNAAGEGPSSAPANANIPNDGKTHTVTVNITASSTGSPATGFNIYRFLATQVPGAPGLTVVVNP